MERYRFKTYNRKENQLIHGSLWADSYENAKHDAISIALDRADTSTPSDITICEVHEIEKDTSRTSPYLT